MPPAQQGKANCPSGVFMYPARSFQQNWALEQGVIIVAFPEGGFSKSALSSTEGKGVTSNGVDGHCIGLLLHSSRRRKHKPHLLREYQKRKLCILYPWSILELGNWQIPHLTFSVLLGDAQQRSKWLFRGIKSLLLLKMGMMTKVLAKSELKMKLCNYFNKLWTNL